MAYFDKWLTHIDDSSKPASVIPVCSLVSETLGDEIATFTAAVVELKKFHKSGEESTAQESDSSKSRKSMWGSGSEYEGSKNTGGSGGSDYEYMHGPLCNQLKSFLERAIPQSSMMFVSKNQHIDVALVDHESQIACAIYEVKTSALPSSQIYTAVGQMFYYKTLYGRSDTKLYLVLPSICKSVSTEDFITSLDIQVVYGESGSFKFYNGESLATAV